LPGRKPVEYQLSAAASDLVVTFVPSVEYEVCGWADTNSNTGADVRVGCTASIAPQRGSSPAPRKPRIVESQDIGGQVQVVWDPADNVTDRYEIERLDWASVANAKAVFKGNDKPTQPPMSQMRNQGTEAVLNSRKAVRPDSSPTGHPPQFATGRDTTWVKIQPVEIGWVPYCSPIGPPGAGPMSLHCMKDDPAKYPKVPLGPPVDPYQYRVCAVNATGRTCSDYVEVAALRPGQAKVVLAVPAPASSTSSSLKAQAPVVPGQARSANSPPGALSVNSASGQPRIQVSRGTAVDVQGRPITPTPTTETKRTATGMAPIAMTPPRSGAIESGTNRLGGDYTNRPLATAQQCQAACASEAQCKACTWVKPGIQGPSAKCWLNN
jgi:hypothetical protein